MSGLFNRCLSLLTRNTSKALAMATIYSSYSVLSTVNCAQYTTLASLKHKIDQMTSYLRSQYSRHETWFPEITIHQKGNTFILEFLIDQRKCDIFTLVIEAVNALNSGDYQVDSKITDMKSFQHGTLKTIQLNFEEKDVGLAKKGTLSIRGEFVLDRPAFKLTMEKDGNVSDKDLSMFMKMFEEANKPSEASETRKKYIATLKSGTGQQQKEKTTSSLLPFQKGSTNVDDTIEKLKEKGVHLIMPDDKNRYNHSWDELGGYEQQKRDIEDTVLLSLTYPEVYDTITQNTRMRFEHNRPKAVLFEGPPGTGKTTSAKIIASEVGIPLLYVPIEVVLSKWYGDAEKNLAEIFEKAAELGRSIIFIDEIDALAVSRSSENTHEASRRLVSTLLRKIDSFESGHEVLLICATNRKENLDPAMLSRLDLSISFDLPDSFARKEIFKRYAKQLDPDELENLAKASHGLSGRAIYEVCRNVERKWASRYIRKEVEETAPAYQLYEQLVNERVKKALY